LRTVDVKKDNISFLLEIERFRWSNDGEQFTDCQTPVVNGQNKGATSRLQQPKMSQEEFVSNRNVNCKRMGEVLGLLEKGHFALHFDWRGRGNFA